MSESDSRMTPGWLLDVVRRFDAIELDPATDENNHARAHAFYTEDDDGLGKAWHVDGLVWLNPPWSRGSVLTWASKAIREARSGAEILMLTLADVRTGWHRLLVDNADARCNIGRSVGFLEPLPGGGYKQLLGHTMGCAVWYFGPRRRRFARVFGPVGEVIQGLGPCELEGEI